MLPLLTMTEMNDTLTFSKKEKLCSKKIIEAIFEKGNKIKSFPFILNYLNIDEDLQMDFPVQIVITVPKRKVKKAVGRNRLKRQIREAYRINKKELVDLVLKQEKKMALFFIYIGKEKENFEFIEKKLIQTIDKLIIELNKN